MKWEIDYPEAQHRTNSQMTEDWINSELASKEHNPSTRLTTTSVMTIW
jgi:hypothetical protein